ncbi:Uncharacterised protein [Vibrio cholerae]|nr:Uncharacterised protein [Vibrio cholerae]
MPVSSKAYPLTIFMILLNPELALVSPISIMLKFRLCARANLLFSSFSSLRCIKSMLCVMFWLSACLM